ncbi:unnamed protein product [Rhizoctonia solani]|uniref:Uncharacterized protein n=1 Tax=Rhizoctonia solani TaxID=456999 RepID=A0A8H2WYH1_9AGAM|nr:unnamed protein product [Rhizoctonia solani]
MSTNEVHPTWGRYMGQYYGSFTFQSLMQELRSNMIAASHRANILPMNKGMAAIRAISNIGQEDDSKKIKSMASGITLQTLRDVLDMSWYKMTLAFLTEPELIRGCIKLMDTVIPNGHKTASPFSYEYGYLCFRIATISFGLCLTEPMLDSAFKAAAQDLRSGRIHPVIIVADIVANSVKRTVQLSPTLKNNKTVNQAVLIVPTRDLSHLLDILWTNRNLFLRTMLHTYTPGMTGLMYVFWQLWRNGRQQSSSDSDIRIGTPLYELLRRCNLASTQDQDAALSALLFDTRFIEGSWLERSKLLDAKDSKTLIRGYIYRITTPATWHYRPDVRSVPPILEFVVRLAQPGAENVFPALFTGTIGFLWNETEGKQQMSGDDLAGISSIFHCLLKLLDIMPDAAHHAMQTLVQELVDSDLTGLVARLIVLRRSTMENSDDERVKNHQFLTKARTFFERLGSKIPPNLLLASFIKNPDDWTRYRNYLSWCSEMLGSSEHNRRYCDAGWEVVRGVPEMLSQGGKMAAKTDPLIKCSYMRCSYSDLMPGMRLVCSDCGSAELTRFKGTAYTRMEELNIGGSVGLTLRSGLGRYADELLGWSVDCILSPR